MKQLKIFKSTLIFFLIVNKFYAQDEFQPWVLGVGINTVDVRQYTLNFFENFEDLIGTGEWSGNTVPLPTRLTVDKYLKKGYTIQLGATFNKLNTIANLNDSDNVTYYSIDALVKYDLVIFKNQSWFDPYAAFGLSFQSIDSDLNGYDATSDTMFTAALGFNLWFSYNFGFNFQTVYKQNLKPSGYDVFQHSVGLVYRFEGFESASSCYGM